MHTLFRHWALSKVILMISWSSCCMGAATPLCQHHPCGLPAPVTVASTRTPWQIPQTALTQPPAQPPLPVIFRLSRSLRVSWIRQWQMKKSQMLLSISVRQHLNSKGLTGLLFYIQARNMYWIVRLRRVKNKVTRAQDYQMKKGKLLTLWDLSFCAFCSGIMGAFDCASDGGPFKEPLVWFFPFLNIFKDKRLWLLPCINCFVRAAILNIGSFHCAVFWPTTSARNIWKYISFKNPHIHHLLIPTKGFKTQANTSTRS